MKKQKQLGGGGEVSSWVVFTPPRQEIAKALRM